MDCETFLAEYSAFRDGDVSREERTAFESHIGECPSCARYHRVVSRGAQVLRGLPEIDVSDDFASRLEGRLYEVDLEEAWKARRAPAGAAAATLSVAAAIALLAWVPLMRGAGGGLETLPSVAARAPRPIDRLAGGSGRPGSLSAQLAALGVWNPPYSDLFHDSPLATPVGTMAGYDGGLALGSTQGLLQP